MLGVQRTAFVFHVSPYIYYSRAYYRIIAIFHFFWAQLSSSVGFNKQNAIDSEGLISSKEICQAWMFCMHAGAVPPLV